MAKPILLVEVNDDQETMTQDNLNGLYKELKRFKGYHPLVVINGVEHTTVSVLNAYNVEKSDIEDLKKKVMDSIKENETEE